MRRRPGSSSLASRNATRYTASASRTVKLHSRSDPRALGILVRRCRGRRPPKFSVGDQIMKTPTTRNGLALKC